MESHWNKLTVPPVSCPWKQCLSVQNSFFSLWHLLGSAVFMGQPREVFSQDTTPHWHIWLLRLEQWWCRQSRREKAREGGLFASARASTAAAFNQSKAHGRGSRPPPALPAPPDSLTPATVPLVSQQAVDFIAIVVFFFLTMCGVCIFSWYADTIKYAV